MKKRVFLVVLDSFGIGEMPDSINYGDKGANTLKSVSKSKYFRADNMKRLGLFNIDGVEGGGVEFPTGIYCRASELSSGKDTTTGHWEMAGLVSKEPFPTYPCGFPDEIISEFEKRTGRKVICNMPYSGTEVIKDYGEEHLKSGDLIVYTSADSVFQIAAHEDIVPLNELYDYCRTARNILKGKHGVGRVIARPFKGSAGNFERSANRHDYSLLPPADTILDLISNAGLTVAGIGKINDIFAGKGISEYVCTAGNREGMEITSEYAEKDLSGLIFVNLVDFDMLYGHRNDIDGYAKAIAEFDNWLSGFILKMKDSDLLIITADHGCDPGFSASTDHSREYVPILMFCNSIKPCNRGTVEGFVNVGKTVCDWLGVENNINGQSLLSGCIRGDHE